IKEEYEYNFTALTSTKIDEDEPLQEQLQKLLKKKEYAKRKSGAEFYNDENKYSQFSSFFSSRD
ncbi:MAG TPA: hypothetical protein VEV15_14820, partial [Flavisolibacter sp.]|nr:hypothetical protein [Flavisolibacter sp.]